MKMRRVGMSRSVLLLLGVLTPLIVAGCGDDSGSLTDNLDTVDGRNLSGIAGPADVTQLAPVERVPRSDFATTNSTAALAYPGLNSTEREVYERGLAFNWIPYGIKPIANPIVAPATMPPATSVPITLPMNGSAPGARYAPS